MRIRSQLLFFVLFAATDLAVAMQIRLSYIEPGTERVVRQTVHIDDDALPIRFRVGMNNPHEITFYLPHILSVRGFIAQHLMVPLNLQRFAGQAVDFLPGAEVNVGNWGFRTLLSSGIDTVFRQYGDHRFSVLIANDGQGLALHAGGMLPERQKGEEMGAPLAELPPAPSLSQRLGASLARLITNAAFALQCCFPCCGSKPNRNPF